MPSGVDNDGTTLISTTSAVYQRQYLGGIDPRWFGVVYGTTTDQSAPYLAAEAVGHVIGSGTVYLGSDTKITGSRSSWPVGSLAHLASNSPWKARSRADANGCSSGLTVKLMEGVAPALYTSWFSDGVAQYSGCTDYSYDLIFRQVGVGHGGFDPRESAFRQKPYTHCRHLGRFRSKALTSRASISGCCMPRLRRRPGGPERHPASGMVWCSRRPVSVHRQPDPGKAAFLSGSIVLRGEFYGFGDTGISVCHPAHADHRFRL